MVHSDSLLPGETCPKDGCEEEIVTVSHQQVPDTDEIADDLCWYENEHIETDGFASLAGNVTIIFHDGPSLDGYDK
jgi:hypothetical protein